MLWELITSPLQGLSSDYEYPQRVFMDSHKNVCFHGIVINKTKLFGWNTLSKGMGSKRFY